MGREGQGLILKDKAVSSLALLELSFESCISQGRVVPAFNPSSPSAEAEEGQTLTTELHL